MLKIFLLFSVCVLGNFGGVLARTESEMRTWFMELGIECNKDHSLSGEDISSLSKHQLPESDKVHCFLACVYQSAKWLNDKGLFDHEAATEMMDKEQLDNPEKLENAKKLIEECKKVNDVAVDNDEKGCKRGALLAQCFFENYPKFNLSF